MEATVLRNVKSNPLDPGDLLNPGSDNKSSTNFNNQKPPL